MNATRRIYGLDLTRSIAIFMAIMVHSINAYDDGKYMQSEFAQILFRTATGTFIIVFGVFLELVYAGAMAKHGVAHAARKLVSRAIQCYVLYVLSCSVLAAVEGYGLAYTLRLALLMGATPYTDILKFYSVMLFLAPVLLVIKSRNGFAPLIIFCIAVHVLHFVFYPIPYPSAFPGSDIVFGFLYGATTVIAGPSVVHGITFVVFGMWTGQFIRGNMNRSRLLDLRKPQVIVVLFACLAIVAIGWMNYEGDYFKALASMEFRNSNSYIYFAFGIAGAILTMDLSLRLTNVLGASRIKPYLFLGETSLFIFCFGNCLLYITRTNSLDPTIAVLATIASVVANVLMAWRYNKLRGRITSLDASLQVVKAYRFITKGYADSIANRLVALLATRLPA